MSARRWIRGCLSAGAAALALVACGGNDDDEGYVATALVTDVAGMQNPYANSNTHIDPNLVNAWGIAFNPQGFVWVANAGTSTSTLAPTPTRPPCGGKLTRLGSVRHDCTQHARVQQQLLLKRTAAEGRNG